MEITKFEIVDCKGNIVAIISEKELSCVDKWATHTRDFSHELVATYVK